MSGKLSITLLGKSHDRSTFSCGIESLDNYLRKQAGQDAKKKVSVTYVLQDAETLEVVGYYTLSSTAIELMAIPEQIRKKLPKHALLPATLIGRLAVSESRKGEGWGEALLADAVKRAFKASKEIASLSVVVDATNESAKVFYKKYGFLDLALPGNRLLLMLNKKDTGLLL